MSLRELNALMLYLLIYVPIFGSRFMMVGLTMLFELNVPLLYESARGGEERGRGTSEVPAISKITCRKFCFAPLTESLLMNSNRQQHKLAHNCMICSPHIY